MNRYGRLAMEHWTRFVPRRVAALTDPEAFFTMLGAQVQAQVNELAPALSTEPASRLATRGAARDDYLQRLGGLRMARLQAEEVVMRDLVWIKDPELSMDEARVEWDETRISDDALARWAERAQDDPQGLPATAEVEALAAEWALSPEFLESLLAAAVPARFLAENQRVLDEAASVRFLREVR
jgi:hypothetical protein